jgi:hypothetical protein
MRAAKRRSRATASANMPRLTEDKLACDFPNTWTVAKYDHWAFYRNRFQSSCTGNKAMDFLGFDPATQTLWLIELKDYRQFRRTKDHKISLWDEVAIKARDTLAGLPRKWTSGTTTTPSLSSR